MESGTYEWPAGMRWAAIGTAVLNPTILPSTEWLKSRCSLKSHRGTVCCFEATAPIAKYNELGCDEVATVELTLLEALESLTTVSATHLASGTTWNTRSLTKIPANGGRMLRCKLARRFCHRRSRMMSHVSCEPIEWNG